MDTVALGFYLFERRTEFLLQKIEESSSKRIAEVSVVEVRFGTPESAVTDAAFGEKTVNMRVPLQISAKCVENTNEPQGKFFSFIILVEHVEDNTLNSFKKTAQKSPVF